MTRRSRWVAAGLLACAACSNGEQPARREAPATGPQLTLARQSCLPCHGDHSRTPLEARLTAMSEQQRAEFLEQSVARNMPPDQALRDLFASELAKTGREHR